MRIAYGTCVFGCLASAAVLAFAAPRMAAQCLVDSTAKAAKTATNATGRAADYPLSYANRQLPRWLCLSAGYRARQEGFAGGGFSAGSSDTYALTRFRLGVLLKPVAWLHAYGELQDATAFARTPPVGPPYQNTWDLRRAFVSLGENTRSPINIAAGRQDLSFGSGRLVGTSYWGNASRGYDAALATLKLRWLRASVFAASQVLVQKRGMSDHVPGNNLHGLYASLSRLVPGSVVEPYVFWRLSRGVRTETAGLGKRNEKTVGARWAGTASRFDYDTELDWRTGHIGFNPIRAWAFAAIAGYEFKSARWKPRVFGEYNFASGDQNPADGIHGSFDVLYPNTHGKHGIADQVGWQNLKEVRSGIRVSAARNWTLSGAVSAWWLASARDAFYSASGGVVSRDPSGRSGTHIGEEFDFWASYRVSGNLEVGAGVGYIVPGEFLLKTNHGYGYTYPYVQIDYNFF